MKKRIGCFITVRVGSSRLPGKCLLRIRGKRVIEYVIDRAKLAKKIDVIVLCTTTNKEDDILINIAKRKRIKYFRGSEKDKLERWNGAAKKFGLDYFVTFDADDIFCDPKLIDLSISQMLVKPCDMIKAPDNLVCGAFTYCISAKALARVCKMKENNDTEMMWSYFTETDAFSVRDLNVRNPIYFSKRIRLTLDYAEDFAFFCSVFDEMKMKRNNVSLIQILKMLRKKSSLTKINFFRHSQFLLNQRLKTNIKLKTKYLQK